MTSVGQVWGLPYLPVTSQKVFIGTSSITHCSASSLRNIGGHRWTPCAESAFCCWSFSGSTEEFFCSSEAGQIPGPRLGHGYKDASILPMCYPPALQWSAPKRTVNFINSFHTLHFPPKTWRKGGKKRLILSPRSFRLSASLLLLIS